MKILFKYANNFFYIMLENSSSISILTNYSEINIINLPFYSAVKGMVYTYYILHRAKKGFKQLLILTLLTCIFIYKPVIFNAIETLFN